MSDKTQKTRRVELPRQVRHKKYGKILHRKTICYVHDENNESKMGDTIEIRECPPKSALKRWELVKIVAKSTAVDLAAMRAAAKLEAAAKQEAEEAKAAKHK
jgi:small subunit ribosomal protein S17